VGRAVAEGVAVASGVSVGLGVRVSSGVAVAVGVGVGEVLFCFGEAVGEGVGVDFLAGRFRCFRAGVGVGVVARNLLIFVPNDSSALLGATFIPKQIATIRRIRRTTLVAANKISGRAPVELLCSDGCRLRNFREENSRSANERDNQATRALSAAFQSLEFPGTARRSGCCRLRG
jgi:hypothetical protein